MARDHEVSPGLWALAWRRLKSDGVAMVSLAIVAFFVVLMIASATGLVAGDWSREIGTNYAPPTWFAGDAPTPAAFATGGVVPDAAPEVKPQDDPGIEPAAGASGEKKEEESGVVDPLADVL